MNKYVFFQFKKVSNEHLKQFPRKRYVNMLKLNCKNRVIPVPLKKHPGPWE